MVGFHENFAKHFQLFAAFSERRESQSMINAKEKNYNTLCMSNLVCVISYDMLCDMLYVIVTYTMCIAVMLYGDI